jgi:hypothetical protein
MRGGKVEKCKRKGMGKVYWERGRKEWKGGDK